MGINKEFYEPRATINWQGQVVCDVRGITPTDITQLMAENAADMETLVTTFERDRVLSQVDVSNDEALTNALTENTTKLFTTLVTTVPDLMAKIIAVAADCADDQEAIDAVRKYVIPLQFEILTQVAKLTFVDQNGFKEFLGKILALVDVAGNGKSGQRLPGQKKQSQAVTTG
jgi:hypothetical protein